MCTNLYGPGSEGSGAVMVWCERTVGESSFASFSAAEQADAARTQAALEINARRVFNLEFHRIVFIASATGPRGDARSDCRRKTRARSRATAGRRSAGRRSPADAGPENDS